MGLNVGPLKINPNFIKGVIKQYNDSNSSYVRTLTLGIVSKYRIDVIEELKRMGIKIFNGIAMTEEQYNILMNLEKL